MGGQIQWFKIISGVFLALAMSPLVLIGIFWMFNLVFRRPKYVEVEGRIARAKVETHKMGVESTTPEFFLSVVCEYTYNNTVYKGRPESTITRSGMSRKMLERAAEVAVNTPVRVFCDPDNPKQFVLDQRISAREILLCVFFIAAGIGFPALWILA